MLQNFDFILACSFILGLLNDWGVASLAQEKFLVDILLTCQYWNHQDYQNQNRLHGCMSEANKVKEEKGT